MDKELQIEFQKQKLKELREFSKMTRKAFAEEYGIPIRTIEDWESGRRKMPDYLLRLLAYSVKMQTFKKKEHVEQVKNTTLYTLDDYMKLPYKIELIPDAEEGGYAVRCPELPGCISCGDTIEEAIENIQDAKREWIYASLEEGYKIPVPSGMVNS